MGFNIKSILPYLAGAAGSGISSQFSALAPFSAAIGAGAGALTDQKNPLGGAAAGFAGGGVGSTLAGGVKGLFSGGTGGALDNFGSGALSGLQSFGSSIPGFGGVGTSTPTGALAKFLTPGADADSVLKNGTKYFSPAPGGGYNPTGVTLPSSGGSTGLGLPASFGGGTTGNAGTTPASSLSPMNMFKSLIPGAAVAGLGGLLAPKVAAPDYSGVINGLQSQIQNGADPTARQAAESQYLSTLNTPNGGSAESGIANAKLINDRQRAQAVRDLQDQFSANNGSLTGNSAYNDALTKLNSTYDQNYSAQAAQTQFQYDTQQQQQKAAAANALQGMDQTQLQYYAGLANLSIEQIQEKTGMDVANSNSIKQIAATAGQLLMEKGLGLGGGK